MATILVTGAGGFIGGHVLEELAARGHHTVAFDHSLRWDLGDRASVVLYLGDVTNSDQVHEAMSHVDGWIHLAAILGTQETIQTPRPAVMANLQGGLNMLEAAAAHKTPGVYISVGNHWMNNPYSISKSTIERFVVMFNQYRGTTVNQVRGMNAYGPRQRPAKPFGPGTVRKIMPSFICRALSGMPIEVYGDGEQVSDMIWVGDLASVLATALEAALRGVVYNRIVECGPIIHNTVNQVAQGVIDAVVGVGCEPVAINHLPMRPGEIPGALVTAAPNTMTDVGIDPGAFLGLQQGIQRTVRWFDENRGRAWTLPAKG